MGVQEKIAEIELEMSRTQKNKATEYHLGQLKAKLAKLRTELQEGKTKVQTGGPGEGFEVQKYGDGRVALIGFPSVGKSTLLSQLTGTESEAAAYEFTTLTCIPGIIHYKGTKIQLLDLPGIIEGAAQGKGRGRQVIAVCKSADLLLMVLDAVKPHTHRDILTRELESVGIRLNREPPRIYLKKKKTGGLSFNSTLPLTKLDEKLVQRVLQEYKVHNADVLIKEDASVDDLIDVLEVFSIGLTPVNFRRTMNIGSNRVVLETLLRLLDRLGNRRYIKCLYVYNKVDMLSIEEVDQIARRENSLPVSCYMELNMDMLLSRMWDMMGLVRVYTKKVGHKPDFSDPVVCSIDRGGTNIKAFVNQISSHLLKEFKYALVWGVSAKHCPQRCGKEHMLLDEDVVQIVKAKIKHGDEGRGRFSTVKKDNKDKKPLRS